MNFKYFRSVCRVEMYDFGSYTTLNEFGYKFNEAGELRNIESDEPFSFVVKSDDHTYNQEHYEALGEVITEEVYALLTSRYGC